MRRQIHRMSWLRRQVLRKRQVDDLDGKVLREVLQQMLSYQLHGS